MQQKRNQKRLRSFTTPTITAFILFFLNIKMNKQKFIEQRITKNYYELLDEGLTEGEAIQELEQKTNKELKQLLSY